MPTNKTKIIALFFLASLAGLFFASPALAAIVPCGGPSTADTGMCTLCHLIVGIFNIFKYAFLIFVGVALLMLVVAGIMYITSAGNTTMMESAKKLMKNVLAGFAIVLLAWLFVNYTMIILSTKTDLGINEGTTKPTTAFQFWYEFNCNTTPASPPPSPPASVITPAACTSFTYSAWSSTCSNGKQTRTIISSTPAGCTGGTPVLQQICTCTSFYYSTWTYCTNGKSTRTVTSSFPAGCAGGTPVLEESCVTSCTNYTYSDWGPCVNGIHHRSVISSYPSGCTPMSPLWPVTDMGC